MLLADLYFLFVVLKILNLIIKTQKLVKQIKNVKIRERQFLLLETAKYQNLLRNAIRIEETRKKYKQANTH